ncbi:MAG: hypothetical protein ACT4P0_13430 [Panacagrimonas sp.]
MKWLRTLILFDKGGVVDGSEWADVHAAYVRAIGSIVHPPGSQDLTLRKIFKYKEGKKWKSLRNGVGYLRQSFINHLIAIEGWKAEVEVNLGEGRVAPALSLYPSREAYSEPVTSEFGDFDLVISTDSGKRVAIEWETGNISSSHRALNKLCIALAAGIVEAGVLIVPSRQLYVHLTDRIGNIGELSPYLEMWERSKLSVPRGLLAVTVVEHDHLTDDENIPYLPSGEDGNAKRGRTAKE